VSTLNASDWIAIASAAIALIALVVAIYAIRRGNLNASVATLVTLNDGFRQGWQRVFSAGADRDHEFAELLNLLEIGCGIHKEKSLVGVSRELSREYIEQVILLMEEDDDSRRQIEKAINTPKTFKYIAWFRQNMRRRNVK
jgi:hypothetical protein